MTECIRLEAGQPAPAFTLPGYDDQPVTLDNFKGRGLILYFYPKDNTAGCTTEALGFRDHLADFEALGYTVVGSLAIASRAIVALETVRGLISYFWLIKKKSLARPMAL